MLPVPETRRNKKKGIFGTNKQVTGKLKHMKGTRIANLLYCSEQFSEVTKKVEDDNLVVKNSALLQVSSINCYSKSIQYCQCKKVNNLPQEKED